MRLSIAVGLLLAWVAVVVVTRSAAAYYVAVAVFVIALLAGAIRIR